MKVSDQFNKNWVSFGLPDVREVSTTYEGSAYSKLPVLPAISPKLEWLCELPESITHGMTHDSFEHSEDEMKAVAKTLETTQPKTVPEAFWQLFRETHLQRRIPSCTACYFDLPKKWTKSPFREGDWMLRFMNDQQCCFCWYLYLTPDETPFVIVSSGAGKEVFLENVDFSKNPELLADAWTRSFYVAAGFEVFLYRFWIENLIWFKMVESIALNEKELHYVRQVAPDYKPKV